MNFVKSLTMLGSDVKEIPCITGSGAPTGNTLGAIGSLYMNATNGSMYKCVNIVGGSRVWENVLGNVETEVASNAKRITSLEKNFYSKNNITLLTVSNGRVDLGGDPGVARIVKIGGKINDDLGYYNTQRVSKFMVCIETGSGEDDYEVEQAFDLNFGLPDFGCYLNGLSDGIIDYNNYIFFENGHAYYHHGAYIGDAQRNPGDLMLNSLGDTYWFGMANPEIIDISDNLSFDGIIRHDGEYPRFIVFEYEDGAPENSDAYIEVARI